MAIAPQRLGIGIRRHFTTEGVDPYDEVIWERRDARITNFRDGSVAFEQTVPLHPWVSALFRLGASYGLRDYDVAVPSDLDQTAAHDNTIGSAHFDVLRADARLEPVIGLILGDGSCILSFQPYYVIARGAIASAQCADCVPGVQLLDFTQNRGIAFALTFHEP